MDSETHRSPMRHAMVVGLALGATVALSAASFAVEAVSTHPAAAAGQDRILVAQATGVKATYSAEQAERGEKNFEKDCVECHGETLRGGLLGGPPLRGLGFEGKYANGSPAGVLYEVMSTTMPPNSPGRYSPETYADLMAYILKVNGFASGAPLPSDIDALYGLIIEK